MQFAIEPRVFEMFPGMQIPAVLAVEIDASQRVREIDRNWQQVWKVTPEVADTFGNAQSHPHVKPWRDRFQAAGFSGKKFPSSIEAMLRRCLKGGEAFRINPLVDLYNTVSLNHIVPAGGFDVDQLHDRRLDLRITRHGDTFLALDANEIEEIPPGEVAYATGHDVLTRHFVWRQSRRALLAESTSSAIFMAEVLGEVGADIAEQVLADLQDRVQAVTSVPVQPVMLSETNPTHTFKCAE